MRVGQRLEANAIGLDLATAFFVDGIRHDHAAWDDDIVAHGVAGFDSDRFLCDRRTDAALELQLAGRHEEFFWSIDTVAERVLRYRYARKRLGLFAIGAALRHEGELGCFEIDRKLGDGAIPDLESDLTGDIAECGDRDIFARRNFLFEGRIVSTADIFVAAAARAVRFVEIPSNLVAIAKRGAAFEHDGVRAHIHLWLWSLRCRLLREGGAGIKRRGDHQSYAHFVT